MILQLFSVLLNKHKRVELSRPKSFIFRILGRFSPCNTSSIGASKKHPIMRKLKLLGCFAVLKHHIFVGTRKKTKQCCRIARLFDAVTAKRGLFKTVLSSTLLCLKQIFFFTAKRAKRRGSKTTIWATRRRRFSQKPPCFKTRLQKDFSKSFRNMYAEAISGYIERVD